MCRYTGLSAPLLFPNPWRQVFSRWGPFGRLLSDSPAYLDVIKVLKKMLHKVRKKKYTIHSWFCAYREIFLYPITWQASWSLLWPKGKILYGVTPCILDILYILLPLIINQHLRLIFLMLEYCQFHQLWHPFLNHISRNITCWVIFLLIADIFSKLTFF